MIFTNFPVFFPFYIRKFFQFYIIYLFKIYWNLGKYDFHQRLNPYIMIFNYFHTHTHILNPFNFIYSFVSCMLRSYIGKYVVDTVYGTDQVLTSENKISLPDKKSVLQTVQPKYRSVIWNINSNLYLIILKMISFT